MDIVEKMSICIIMSIIIMHHPDGMTRRRYTDAHRIVSITYNTARYHTYFIILFFLCHKQDIFNILTHRESSGYQNAYLSRARVVLKHHRVDGATLRYDVTKSRRLVDMPGTRVGKVVTEIRMA